MRTATPGIRQRIFDAAAKRFAVDRFHEVRMDDVATEAGVSKGTLYRYFNDKEDLYRALIVTASKQLLENIDTRMERSAEPQAKLEAMVGTLLDFFDDHPYFFDLLQRVEVLSSSDGNAFPWAKTRKEFTRRVSELTRQCQASSPAPPLDPTFCALMLLGSTRAVVRFGQRPRPEGLAKQLVAIYLHGLLHGQAVEA